jgi:alpha-L-fucosidase
VERLAAIGKWMKVNGEAIYKTESLGIHYKQGENIRLIKKKGKPIYYAIAFSSPGNQITIKNIQPRKDSKIFLLGSKSPLKWEYSDDKEIHITIPGTVLDALGETQAWTFKITGEEVHP